ncbi:acyltransferase family protein [Larkinella terrae]|uniref:DUF5009 domain-containing protein n=1 Tax=Larkinella terrae TaxID=2025311 RepID=A0A7K0EI74_9BACT|nr:DUF5009 domain-containing protein [Larkinella terrae]MRS61539.1 DUF5009 domain-containing protein [Larkinella terrae]
MQQTSTAVSEPALAQPAPVRRLKSLDALRGFDMFWIAGGEEIFYVLAKTTGWAWAAFMAEQFTHVEWNGFRPYDCIFPLFLFMAGVSTPFAVGSRIERGVPKSELARKMITRGLILVLLGIIYNNGILVKTLSETRFGSVLGRIGLAGMFAQLIYLYFPNPKVQYAWFAGLLLAYWAMMKLIPVPGCGAGLLTIDCSLAGYIDRSIMPGRLYLKVHDPEGLFSTIPAIGTAMLGIFSGQLLKSEGRAANRDQKTLWLVLGGLSCLVLGYSWGLVFPINKNLWTSSFVLVAGGWSVLMLALFYWIIDVKNVSGWAFFFTVIGMNSILIYIAGEFIDFEYASKFFFHGILSFFSEPVQAVGAIVGLLAVKWVFLYFLYKKKVFLRV